MCAMSTAPRTSAAGIIDAIGRSVLAEALRVRPNTIRMAAAENKLPARWFRVVRRLHPEAPLSAFNFISPNGEEESHPATVQEAAQ